MSGASLECWLVQWIKNSPVVQLVDCLLQKVEEVLTSRCVLNAKDPEQLPEMVKPFQNAGLSLQHVRLSRNLQWNDVFNTAVDNQSEVGLWRMFQQRLFWLQKSHIFVSVWWSVQCRQFSITTENLEIWQVLYWDKVGNLSSRWVVVRCCLSCWLDFTSSAVGYVFHLLNRIHVRWTWNKNIVSVLRTNSSPKLPCTGWAKLSDTTLHFCL